jgi:hypothetical protein
MKHRLVVVGLLAGGLASSHSAISGAAVERTRFRGEIAELALFQQTEITCGDGSGGLLDRSLTIQLFADGVRSTLGDSDTRALLLFFSEFSSCTGTSRDFIAFEEPEEYSQNRVHSASFAHSFELVDVFSGDPMGTLTFDVELTGVGETGHIHTHSTSRSGDFLFHSVVNGVFREAAASGSVDLDGTELIDSGQFASLSDIRSGDMTVTH